ncbi:type II toxin-antitoxin system VapC family toxin [Thauera aromatica]|uniref:type II toxin-antitoxin system VapC family toxin n=1 Tax=Thauera aromatica TaxID=59405 RepID=UPI001FFC9762|nr:type II toxin-antitoxin system VapC family toxin [Thauera aromatica]MCK2097553.1 type II toxin-antitoxin system VapC family toxin [Thauera aromatica]
MRVLLDTHALLWFLLDDPALSRAARELIRTPDTAVLVSPASYWEIAIKISIGKYRLPEPLAQFMARELAHNRFDILPIGLNHADRVARLPFHHRDPFELPSVFRLPEGRFHATRFS